MAQRPKQLKLITTIAMAMLMTTQLWASWRVKGVRVGRGAGRGSRAGATLRVGGGRRFGRDCVCRSVTTTGAAGWAGASSIGGLALISAECCSGR